MSVYYPEILTFKSKAILSLDQKSWFLSCYNFSVFVAKHGDIYSGDTASVFSFSLKIRTATNPSKNQNNKCEMLSAIFIHGI